MTENQSKAPDTSKKKKDNPGCVVAVCLTGSVLACVLYIVGVVIIENGEIGAIWFGLGFLTAIVSAMFSVNYYFSDIPKKAKITIGISIITIVLLYGITFLVWWS